MAHGDPESSRLQAAQWWVANRHAFPLLFPVALDATLPLASSSDSERMGSYVHQVLHKKALSSSASTVQTRSFISCNIPLAIDHLLTKHVDVYSVEGGLFTYMSPGHRMRVAAANSQETRGKPTCTDGPMAGAGAGSGPGGRAASAIV